MNIALGAVIIFILLIPPIAFYFSYSFGRYAKAGPKFSLLDSILASAIFSLFIHTLAIVVTGSQIRFDILLKLLGGELKDLETKITNSVFTAALKQFALYNAIILLLAVLLGRMTRFLVNRSGKLQQSELLRPKNKWWYLFNGFYLTDVGFSRREFDLLFVDAVIDTNDGTTIYSGYLVDFVCEGEELQRIYLSNTSRRNFRKKEAGESGDVFLNEPGEAIAIPGEIFCIAYKDTKNLNLRFIILENSLADIEELPEEPAVETS